MKLTAWLKRDHSLAERLAVVAGVCSALADAHRRGVVRGGLEPAGVEVEGDGTCRLDSDPPRPGSPYAAPEAAFGGPPTAKAEIYSGGLIFYEVLAGQPAFESRTRRPLQELRPDLPSDLTDAVTACLEEDPEWRPADLSYLLAVVRGLQRETPTPAPTPQRRVTEPPRTFLETGTRRRHDDRSPLTRGLPVILVLVAMLATGGAWLWFEVLRPERPAAGGGAFSPRNTAPPTTAANAGEPNPSLDARSLPSASPLTPSPVAVPSVGADRPSAAPTPVPSPRASSSPRPVVPAGAPPGTPPLPPQATDLALPPAPVAPTPVARSEETEAAPPTRSNPEPTSTGSNETATDQASASGPASIRAIAPFRLRPGVMTVLDVHGSNLRADHRARFAQRREPAVGFTVTRYQLRSPGLLLVFLQVDSAVRPGKYAFSLMGPDGGETNAFTIEVANK